MVDHHDASRQSPWLSRKQKEGLTFWLVLFDFRKQHDCRRLELHGDARPAAEPQGQFRLEPRSVHRLACKALGRGGPRMMRVRSRVMRTRQPSAFGPTQVLARTASPAVCSGSSIHAVAFAALCVSFMKYAASMSAFAASRFACMHSLSGGAAVPS